MIPVALTVAGSDPSGGAGIQADLKTFHQRDVYGMAVLSLLTVQNTRGIREVLVLDALKVAAQLDAVLADISPQAAKTGALGSEAIIRVLAERAVRFSFPLVVDPVMVSTHGEPLLMPGAWQTLTRELLPHAFLVMPNLDEAGELSGMVVTDLHSMEMAARKIAGTGVKAVLVKGGHLVGAAADLLYHDGRVRVFTAARIAAAHTHGTGCTYSAAVTAELAKGRDLESAVETAKQFVTQAIREGLALGSGSGPVNHHVRI